MSWLFDDNKNKVEGLSKEEIYAVLAQAIEDGDLEHIDTSSAFVSKLKSVLTGETHSIEFVTEAQYNTMKQAGTLDSNTYYYITDDSTLEDIEAALESLETDIENIQGNLEEDSPSQFGDYTVSKKKLLWSGNVSISSITPVEICSLSEALSPNAKAVEFICSSNANGDYSIKVPLTNTGGSSKYVIDYGFYPNVTTPYITYTKLYLSYSSNVNKFYGYCERGEYYINTQTSDNIASTMNVTKIYEIIE